MQFRNAFDAQGPAVPGISPMVAVNRLKDFQNRYALYETKRKTLDSVSKLFGIPCKPFEELDRTGEELSLLGMLYGLFQKFIRFDEEFRDTLWADVDLKGAYARVEEYWDECLALPSKLKDWGAYHEMKTAINNYLNILPLLQRLATREIRNRHWLQVMHVTHSAFQLEANVFKLCHLLDINLINHSDSIEEICYNAAHEQQLEIRLKQTEDEWTDQVLIFTHYKKRGNIYLDKKHTERLLEQLDDSKAMLATMLTSRHVGPMRDEAANWAEKLKQVSLVLEEWLTTQDLWQYLEAVFSQEKASKELPQEVKRFARIDKGWTKMMKRAAETRSVLQCCYGDDVPKAAVLRNIHEELEICFKSLTSYLNAKRHAFPRFFFVSDSVLLAILSKPNDLESARPHLKSIFSGINNILVEQVRETERDRRSSMTERSNSRLSASPFLMTHSETPPKIDKRLHTLHTASHTSTANVPTALPSELMADEVVNYEAVAVTSSDGEHLRLREKVQLAEGVEMWLSGIEKSSSHLIKQLLIETCEDALNEGSCADWAYKFPVQVCKAGLHYLWTLCCEKSINEMKLDRKSLANGSKKFASIVSKIPSTLARGYWRNFGNEPIRVVQRRRLEALCSQALFLKDMFEEITRRKIRDITDFDWRRTVRFYLSFTDVEQRIPAIHILDDRIIYGCEFYGCESFVGLSPATDKAFFNMSQALSRYKGSLLYGDPATGKTDTVRSFAQITANFLAMFQLSSETSSAALCRVLKGLAICGCWGLIEDVQTASTSIVNVLLDHISSIQRALKTAANSCHLGDGHEISLKPNTAFFLTCSTVEKSCDARIPNELRPYFRTISMLKPDPVIVLKAKAAAYGLKSPTILAQRLTYFSEICTEQL